MQDRTGSIITGHMQNENLINVVTDQRENPRNVQPHNSYLSNILDNSQSREAETY